MWNISFIPEFSKFSIPEIFELENLKRISEWCNWYHEDYLHLLENKQIFEQIQLLSDDILQDFETEDFEKINIKWKSLIALVSNSFHLEESLYAKDILLKIWWEIEISYKVENFWTKKIDELKPNFENMFYIMYKLCYQKVMRMIDEWKISIDQVYDLKDMNAHQMQKYISENSFDADENTALINFDRYHYSFFKDWLELENYKQKNIKSISNIKF